MNKFKVGDRVIYDGKIHKIKSFGTTIDRHFFYELGDGYGTWFSVDEEDIRPVSVLDEMAEVL